MAVLRYLTVVALALWVGGLAALGGVGAPTLFSALEGRDGAAGRETAGWLFGILFGRFQQVSWVLGAVILILLGIRAALGPRPRRFGIRVWMVALMLAVSLATSFLIAPRINAIRVEVNGPIASLPDTDTRKITFGRLLGLSNGLMLLTVFAGLWLLWTESRE